MSKKFYIIVILLTIFAAQSFSQSITNYSFASASGTFTTLSSPTNPPLSGNADDGYFNGIPIGFDFWYTGTRYTTISASTNGWLKFGSNITNDLITNSLANGSERPCIAPLWDDIDMRLATNLSYETNGVAGSRVFTVQYLNAQWDYSASGNSISFQAKLYEATGKIEFVYSPGTGALVSPDASIGIAATATGSGNFRSLNNSGSAPGVSSTYETTTINAKPINGQTYRFTPVVPTAPGALSFSAISATSMTINWADNSSNESGFVIYSSTDGINYYFASQSAAGATSSAQTGLTVNTLYYWKVFAVSEGALSAAVSGSRSTSCTAPVITQVPASNLILYYKLDGNAIDETGVNDGTLINSPSSATNRFGFNTSAYTFNGTNQQVTTSSTPYTNPTNFTESVWFKTNTTTGGKLIGFGNSKTGTSSSHDRALYMNNAGKIYFGVYDGSTNTINSPQSYNDNNWHLATATFSSSAGMKLYMDGVQVAANASYTTAEYTTGYWRIGYDNLSGWPSAPSSFYFDGTMDDILIYHRALSAAEVAILYNSPDGAGGNSPVCAGSALNLTATTVTGGIYSWAGPNGFTSASQNPALTFSPSAVGLYTLNVSVAGCSSTATAYVNVAEAATSSVISYASSPYCKNAGTASVSLSGTAGGIYTSTAGLSINSTTGNVNLAASTAGTYLITYTISGGCTATASITITNASTATISYAGSPFCKSLVTGQPVTFTGSTGGTYSSTVGLTINAATGTITPSTSTTGTYTVTYTIPVSGGCAASATTTSVTIGAVPTASASATQTCVGGSTGTITVSGSGGQSPYTYSLNGGAYQASASFTGLAAAAYTINVMDNYGCIGSGTVTVNGYAASADNQNDAGTNAWIGHVYDGTSFNNYIGRYNETENFNQQYGGSTNCFSVTSGGVARSIYTESFSVRYRMNSTKRGLYIANLGSDDGGRLYVDGSLISNSWNDQAFVSKPRVLMNFTGASALIYEFYENSGGNQLAFQSLTQVLANTLSANTTQTICLGNGGTAISGDTYGTLPVGIALSGTGYQWSYSTSPAGARTVIAGATGATFTPSTLSAPFNAAGTYYLYRNAALTSTNNISPNPYTATNESNSAIITIVAMPAATISYAASPYCSNSGTATVTRTGTAGGTYSSTAGLTLDATTGNITLATSTPGTYTITYTMTNAGCTITTTNPVVITATPAATISYAGTPYCSSAGTASVTRTGTVGGTYSSTTGLIINATSGNITLATSSAGTYTVTYTIAASAGCAIYTTTTPVTITTVPAASISYPASLYCANGGTVAVTRTGTAGGTYSSTAGLTIDPATGAITLGTSTAGTYTVTYTIAAAGGCGVYNTTTTMQVLAVIDNNQLDFANGAHGTICATPNENGTASLIAPAGTVFVTVPFASYGTPNGSCAAFTVGACNSTISQSVAEGYLLGYNTVSIPATNAIFTDPCQGTVKRLYVQATYTQPICSGTSPGTLSGTTPTGGTGSFTYAWEYSTTSASTGFSAAPGTNNVKDYTPGVLSQTTWYRRTVTSGGCSNTSAVILVPVSVLPAATISYSGSPYCSNATTASVVRTGTTGGTFSSTAGLTINSTTGDITIGSSTAGTYTVTYTIAAAGGCAVYTTTTSITITLQPNATGYYAGNPYCSNAGIAFPSGASVGASGTLTSTPGLSIAPSTGVVTLGTSTAGTYTVTYTVPASGGCAVYTNTSTIVITAAPSASISYAGSPYCSNAGTATVTRTGTAGGTYSSTPGLTINSITGAITLGTSTAGTYTVTYTIAASGGCAAYTKTTTVTITDPPSATISYNGSPYCSNAGTATVSRTGNAGGTYTSTAGLTINSTTGNITLGTSTAGTYTVTYTIAAAGGCTAYSATTSVTVSAPSSATISYAGSPYCSNAGIITVTNTGTTGGTFNAAAGLSINSTTGAVNTTASTLGTYTVTYTINAASGCGQSQGTTAISIVTPGRWTGAVNTDWNTGGNWLCGSVPGTTINAVIPAGLSNYPVITGTMAVNNITVETGASLTVTGTLQVAGAITNTGNFDASGGTINMNGSTPQTIPANAFLNNTIGNLVLNNNVTLGGPVAVAGTLSFGSSNLTFNTADMLTLASSPSGTARVGAVPVDAAGVATSFISGKVSVERYIPNRRAWRLLTSPLSNTGNIYNSWQNAGVYQAGKGIFITGPGSSAANGIDASVQNTISMKTYNPTTQAYINIGNTKSSLLSGITATAANIGYFTFVRGDRNPNNLNASYSNSTTLKSSGYLQTGKQVFAVANNVGGYTIMGNPYASPVDFNKISRTHVMKRFYAWDPNLNTVGGYVALDDLNNDGIYSKSVPGSLQDQHIQSGQAFFVLTDTTGPANITYYESSKSSMSNNAVFRPLGGAMGSFVSTLKLRATDGTTIIADAVLAEFDDNFSAGVNLEDAAKFGNTNETFSLLRNGTQLSIERRPVIGMNDTLFFSLTKTTARDYQFVINMTNMDAPGLMAVLEDKFTGINTPLSMTGNTTINFTISGNAASIKPDRFQVVFSQAGVLPVTYTSVTARQKGKDIEVNWKVEEQLNIQRYEIEKSTDGSNFVKVTTQAVTGAATSAYNWIDVNAVTGNNYYRIRNIDRDGSYAFSKVVTVNMGNTQGEIAVYPNPVTEGVINVQLTNLPAGTYAAQLISATGQVLLVKEIKHPGGSGSQKIRLHNETAKGSYQLKIVHPDKLSTTTITVLNQ